MSKKIRVLILAGGPSSEHKISLKTADQVLQNLDPEKYDAQLAVIQRNETWDFKSSGQKALHVGEATKYIVRSKFDVVFIAMHGALGEDGHVQAHLELLGLPYTGSQVLSSAVAMDKEISNTLYSASGLA